jgi:hypothetical protein
MDIYSAATCHNKSHNKKLEMNLNLHSTKLAKWHCLLNTLIYFKKY